MKIINGEDYGLRLSVLVFIWPSLVGESRIGRTQFSGSRGNAVKVPFFIMGMPPRRSQYCIGVGFG